MRSVAKSESTHHILKFVPKFIISSNLDIDLEHIVDRVSLLHKFSHPKHSSYADISMMYTQHVQSNYGRALVVFDRCHGSSTKDETHHQ